MAVPRFPVVRGAGLQADRAALAPRIEETRAHRPNGRKRRDGGHAPTTGREAGGSVREIAGGAVRASTMLRGRRGNRTGIAVDGEPMSQALFARRSGAIAIFDDGGMPGAGSKRGG